MLITPLVALILAGAPTLQDHSASPLARDRQAVSAPGEFPPPVELYGLNVRVASLNASVNVHRQQDDLIATRSIVVNGSILRPELGRAPDPDADAPMPMAAIRSYVQRLDGDGGEIRIHDPNSRRDHRHQRRSLSQMLMPNPQMPRGRGFSSGWTAHTVVDALPSRIDRLDATLDLVRAGRITIERLPIEVTDEHVQIQPGVRFLLRTIEQQDRYTRFSFEYFIDRDPENAGETADGLVDLAPLVPAILLRDKDGNVVHMWTHLQEVETRDAHICSVADASVSTQAAARAAYLEVVVLDKLSLERVVMTIRDLPLAG
ncbi:MAG: hypothetical protein AAFX79_04200 [Planctomycetota bacterium]